MENVSSHTNKNQAPNVNNLTFSSSDLSSFCQLNNLGLTATGQHLCAERFVIECRFTKAAEPCPKCGAPGVSRGTVDGRLAYAPYGGITQAVQHLHTQNFPMERYAGP